MIYDVQPNLKCKNVCWELVFLVGDTVLVKDSKSKLPFVPKVQNVKGFMKTSTEIDSD